MNPRTFAFLLVILTVEFVAIGLIATMGFGSSHFIGLIILNLTIVGVAVLIELMATSGGKNRQYEISNITLNGERVKSKGEKLIADYFYHKNIRYIYERPARTTGLISRHVSYPDFYLPEFDVHVEYWGLVNAKDDKRRAEYVRSMKWKMAQYYNNDIKFISIYPHNLDNLDWILERELRDIKGENRRQR